MKKHCRIKVISEIGALESYCEVYGFTEMPNSYTLSKIPIGVL